MDKWKFYDVTHREHVFCNPMSTAKIDRLIELLRLDPGARVLDIGSGKGEFLIRLVEAYCVSGVGVDISPHFIAAAIAKMSERVPTRKLEFIEMDAAKYQPEREESFQLAACLGASWIFDGHRGTLEFLNRMVAPGGWVVAGEPYWIREPTEEYLELSGDRRESFGTHDANVAVGEAMGLRLSYTLVSSEDDWDEYEGLQWYAAEDYARRHPDDFDVPEIIARLAGQKTTYLKCGRSTLGWAIYVFRKPGS